MESSLNLFPYNTSQTTLQCYSFNCTLHPFLLIIISHFIYNMWYSHTYSKHFSQMNIFSLPKVICNMIVLSHIINNMRYLSDIELLTFQFNVFFRILKAIFNVIVIYHFTIHNVLYLIGINIRTIQTNDSFLTFESYF